MGYLLDKAREKTREPRVTPVRTIKPDLKTSIGLQQLAEERGLGEQAKRITAVGEDPKKIFSGGFISDTFDVLNALQFGVTGLIKGKGFVEGVKTRQSFSDKDALGQFGLPGMLAGIVTDIAVDPLTYFGGFGLIGKIGKIPKVAKAIKGVRVATAGTRVGNKLGSTFIYRFGQDPIYREMAERSTKNIAIGNQNVMELIKPITRLSPKTQRAILAARKAGKLDDLPTELLDKAKPAFDELDRLGNEAVREGLLKKEVYDENIGKYIARLYRKHEVPPEGVEKIKAFFDVKPLRIDITRFKKRTDIPDEVREAMGEILEAGYPTAKSLLQLKQAVERSKFFRQVAKKWGKDIVEDGFKALPKTPRLGNLSGKAVPIPIFDDIQEIIRVKGPAEKLIGNMTATFKFNKVIMNPSTHARNIMSNFILNDFEGLSPARIDIYARAAKELATKGKVYKEARTLGLGLDTFAAQEIRGLLTSPEAVAALGKVGKTRKALTKMADKLGELYQKEEEFAKMAQYIFQKGKGKTPEQALEIAERATFNYAQVTPFIRRLRESLFGLPFITFTAKVTPQVARTLITKPGKISKIGKIKQAIESQSGLEELERERATEPDWVRDGFYVKLPMKDKFNRSAYLDLTYILPFGDLMSGQLLERGISRETGLPQALPSALLKKSPGFNLIGELGKNQDFFGNKIFRESDSLERQSADIMRHIMKMFLPPLLADQIPGGFRASGERRPIPLKRIIELEREGIAEAEFGGKQTRSLMQELMKQVGLKIQPVDIETQESFAESQRKRALKTLLQERGAIREFKIPTILSD